MNVAYTKLVPIPVSKNANFAKLIALNKVVDITGHRFQIGFITMGTFAVVAQIEGIDTSLGLHCQLLTQ